MAPKRQTNVQVFVRVRPFNSREENEGDKGMLQALQVNGNACRMLNPKKDMEVVREEFVFDHCFDSTKLGKNASQADVYAKLGPLLLDSCYSGYNACLFAYGQTGSGKTHTMMGELEDEHHKGVIPRLVTEFFERLEVQKSQSTAKTFKLEASYLEIYCERVKDLLVRDGGDLQVRSTPERGVFIDGLTTHRVTNAKDVYKLLSQGAKNRAVACTNMNAHSSRSHAILTLNYTETMFASSGDQKVQTRCKTSRMYLVDLAGSERVKMSGVTGMNFDEAKKINQSLTSLGRIIDLLAERKPGKQCVLPVRESTLTWLLADSLGGNSKTIMMAAVSPSASSFDETLSTLRYAARTKCIINETSVNEIVDLKLMDELRGQIDELQVMLKNQSELELQLQTNEEKMSALQQLLENEKIAKERSDLEQREKAEEEKRAYEERLQLERDQVEQYLQERVQLQERLDAAIAEVDKLEQRNKTLAADVETERRMKDHHERAVKDVTEQSSVDKQRLQEKCEASAKKIADLDALVMTQANERANLQAKVEELQRRIADMQREFQVKEQGWKQEMELLQSKLERTCTRLQDLEKIQREKEIDWAKAKDDLTARYEMEIARVTTGNNAKFSEVTQEHQQAMETLQKQSDERFQRLKDDLKQQFEADLQRNQQQHEAAMCAVKQQAEEENRRMRQQHESLVQEMNAMRSANKRQQAECQWLKQQYEQCQEEVKLAKSQCEEQVEQSKVKHTELLEQARQQYEQECQRILHQQGEAVKEVHKKRDTALADMRKKVAEEIERLKRSHEEKVSKLKAAHDEALTTLQFQVDATWEHQRQEHSRAMANQQTHYALEIEELQRRLEDVEIRLEEKQREAENAESTSAGYIRDLEDKFQVQDRRHKEEFNVLAQKLATVCRLYEQHLELSKQTEDQVKASQRRLEVARLNGLRELQECRLPTEQKLALHGFKSPKLNGDGRPPESPCSRRSDALLTALPTTPRDIHSAGAAVLRYRESPGTLCSPDVRQLQRLITIDSPSKHMISPKKCFSDDGDGILESIDSFNGGDKSMDTHPDFKLLDGDNLALF